MSHSRFLRARRRATALLKGTAEPLPGTPSQRRPTAVDVATRLVKEGGARTLKAKKRKKKRTVDIVQRASAMLRGERSGPF